MKLIARWVAILAVGIIATWIGRARAATPPPLAPLPPLPEINIAALAVSSDRLFVGGFDAGVWMIERDGQVDRLEDPAVGRHVNALAWDEHERELWIGTARGLARCELGHPIACARVGDTAAVHAVVVLRDGSVVAGGDAGLWFVGPHGRVTTFDRKQGAPFRSVWSLAEGDRGELFVGSTSGLFWGSPSDFVLRRGSAIERAALVNGLLSDDWVTALAIQSDTLYVGTYNAGVARFLVQGNQLSPNGEDQALGYVNPAGLSLLGGGAVAIATMDGLQVGRFGETHLVPTLARDVTAVVPIPWRGAADYWIATRKGLAAFSWTAPPR